MKRVKTYALCLLACVLFLACSKGEKKVLSSYDNGQEKVVAYYKDGKKVYQEVYYENGKLRSEGDFDDSVRTGKWCFYFEDGKTFAKADFSKEMRGEQWQVYKDDGEKIVNPKDTITDMAFSPEGTLVSVAVKVKGNEKITYRFFNSFHLMTLVHLKGNVPQGKALSWHENGQLNSEVYYLDGMKDSTYVVYSESGQKMISGQYDKDVKIGKWEFFDSQGSPLGIEIYDKDGTILKENENTGLRFSHRKKTETKE